MGLSNFPSASEGVLPVLVMNTVLSLALLKNMLKSIFQIMGFNVNPQNIEEAPDGFPEIGRVRRISITQFKSLCHERSIIVTKTSSSGGGSGSSSSSSSSNGSAFGSMDCCVCLCGFEADEEVSELSCKHFFHKGCLEKWFVNKRATCPLCRSID